MKNLDTLQARFRELHARKLQEIRDIGGELLIEFIDACASEKIGLENEVLWYHDGDLWGESLILDETGHWWYNDEDAMARYADIARLTLNASESDPEYEEQEAGDFERYTRILRVATIQVCSVADVEEVAEYLSMRNSRSEEFDYVLESPIAAEFRALDDARWATLLQHPTEKGRMAAMRLCAMFKTFQEKPPVLKRKAAGRVR
jgi:hypothetical protein